MTEDEHWRGGRQRRNYSGPMSRRLAHPGRASRLHEGVREVHPHALRADLTVWVAVEDESAAERTWEGLAARWQGEDSAVLAAIPVLASGLALGDVVGVTQEPDGMVCMTAVVSHSGNTTFRVWFTDDNDPQLMRRFEEAVTPYWCWLDVYSSRLVGLSVVPEVLPEVIRVLNDLERDAVLMYEVGLLLDNLDDVY